MRLLKSVTLILLSLIIASPVAALPSDEILDYYAINGIYYYDPSGCEEDTPVEASGENITWIGDSYTAIAEEDYKLISTNLPGTDLGSRDNPYYQVSKHIQMDGGPGNLGGKSGLNILKDIKSQNQLRPYLVFALSTNDTDLGDNPGILMAQLNTLIDSTHASIDTTVILVTPHTNDGITENAAYARISEVMRNFANTHDNVLVADWNKEATGKESEYFGSDPTHPNQKGFEAWFNTIKNTLPQEVNGNESLQAATLPAETIQILENEHIRERVEANMERYKYAEEKTKLPWQILAVLHYREGGLGENKSISNGEELYDHINVDGIHISADPNQDAVDAANHFIENARGTYGIDVIKDPTMENYAMGFLAYNRGFMYKDAGVSWEESPYVMNGYDADHMHMRWTHADSWYAGQRLNGIEGKIDSNPGALAILAYLGTTATYSGKGCEIEPTDSGAAIAQMAVNMAWPFQDGSKAGNCIKLNGEPTAYVHRDGIGGCSMNPRDTYEKAVTDFHIYPIRTDDYRNCKDSTYCDCGMFVQTVLAATFPDEPFANHNPNEHEAFVDFLLSQPDKWEEIENLGNTSNLQPGDVFLNPGHRMIYVGEYGGKWGDLASASAGQNVGEISEMYFDHHSGPFRIFRRKGGISENGLTFDQAKTLAYRYGENKNDDSRRYSGSRDEAGAGTWQWDHVSSSHSGCYDGNNCVTFSRFFTNKFATDTPSYVADGQYLANLMHTKYPNSEYSTSKPFIFSIFSSSAYGKHYGGGGVDHTGIVVGREGDNYIVAEAACGKNGRGAGDINDMSYNGPGFGYVEKIPAKYLTNGDFQFFKLNVDESKLLSYINNGP